MFYVLLFNVFIILYKLKYLMANMNSSIRVVTIFGIPIRIHFSIFILFILLVLSHGFIHGTIIMLILWLSIATHELAHSLVALSFGCKVIEIDLMIIGGAARMASIPTKPYQEFLMAIAGPAISFILGIPLIAIGIYLKKLPPVINQFEYHQNVLEIAGTINIGLALFNLLPAFPMDGGRILRALLATKIGRRKATLIASRLGKAFAIFFGLAGYYFNNWILIFIAFFIFIAANREYRYVELQEQIKKVSPVIISFSDENTTGDDEDEVIIGPPPYEKE